DETGRRPGEAALEALARFREREGASDAGRELLLRGPEAEDAPKRRSELIEGPEREHGMARDRALLIDAAAGAERLGPASAYETVVEGAPEWVAPPAPAEVSPARERLLRASFRRLRRHLDDAPTAEAAIAAFVAEPDVGEVAY